jgi:nicotinamide-nucleotide amidase
VAQGFRQLLSRLAEGLSVRGEMLATAESCTGGWVAKVCTDLAGSSTWFERGFVTYSNQSKQDMLGVSADTLADFGAVSEQVVLEMASGALAHSRAQWALAISGVAGPSGGTPEKPVGTVWLAWAGPGEWRLSRRCDFKGDRDAVRRQAMHTAIEVLVQHCRVAGSKDEEHKRRLFLALWPDDETRARLARVAREWSTHPVATANLHMTLHFLGACTPEQQQRYSKVISEITFEQFEINMNCLGGSRRSQIQWLGSSEPPAALIGLVDRLGQALAGCGYQVETRPFLPHVTLSRHVKKPAAKAVLPAISWVVRELALVESIADANGVHYAVRVRWTCS